jgi:hypothetical protein
MTEWRVRGYENLLLGLIPAVYVLIGMHANLMIGLPSLRNIDPEFIYYISGISVAEGRFDLGHTDNPGTPLQYLAALVFRLVYLFRAHDVSFIEDILAYPDLYLNILNHVILLMVGVGLFIAGGAARQVTGAIPYGLVVQTMPFYAEITYDIAGRVIPELLLPVPIAFFTIVLLRVISENKVSRKSVTWLAVLSALALSVKYTTVTLWIIPLLVIPSWKEKGRFLLLSILLFCVFAIPAVIRPEESWRWLRGLVIHSGQYGSGSNDFVDWSVFLANLSYLYKATRPFFALAGLLVLVAIFIPLLKKDFIRQVSFRISIAVILVILVHLFMVSKHYAYRYMVPVLDLLPLIILLVASGIEFYASFPKTRSVLMALILLLFIPGVSRQARAMHQKNRHISTEVQHKMDTWHRVRALGHDHVRLIASKSYGCPYPEYALMFSDAWAGKQRGLIRPTLEEMYPDSYFYFTWDRSLRYWGTSWDSLHAFDRGKPVILYLEKDSPEMLRDALSFFFGNAYGEGILKAEATYINPQTGESIYDLKISTN